MREKILDKLGITEEKLQSMTPKQRADLAKRVDEEIQRILAAERELNKDQDEWNAFRNNQLNSPVVVTGVEFNSTAGELPGKSSLDLFELFSEMEKGEEEKTNHTV